jgi:hypothetical protein
MAQSTVYGVPIDTDPTLSANSNQLVPSQAAVVTYVGVTIASNALPVTATENQVLLSNNLAAPEWSTATYPPTAGASGNLLTSDGTNWLSSTPAVVNTAAVTKAITQVAHGFVVGDLLYLVGITYTKAIATSAAASEVVGMVSAVAGVDDFTLTTSGRVTGIPVTVAGTVYFLSPTTAGLYTSTEPSTIGQLSKPVLVADTTSSGYLMQFRGNVIAAAGLVAQDVAFYAGYDATMTLENIAVQTYGELVMSRTGSFTGEAGYIDTVCTGAATILDILKNGTTIYTTKPQFAVSTNTLTAGTVKSDGTEDFVSGDRVTFKITQIGSTIAGQGVRFTAKAEVSLI